MSKRHILKSAGVIGFATVISRILGFIRDILIAKYFGTLKLAQAFVVAFRIPNMLRDLIGEGATNSAFVPVLSEYVEKKKEEFWLLAGVLLNAILVTLSLITILGIILSPVIVRLIAPGFIADPEKLAITISLTRLLFPYLLLVGLLAYSMGVLNSLRHFSAPAFAPAILNLAMIVSILLRKDSVFALAISILVGGVLQLIVQLPVLLKMGFKFSFRVGFYHTAVKSIAKLLMPRALGSCVYQINIFINTMLASLSYIVGEGGVAALYYANRIFQFPLAIFGISVAQAALPTMSREALEQGFSKLKETLSFSLRAINFVMIPASFGLMVLATPITRVLFERGLFDSYSTLITSEALLFYSIGLFSYAGIKVLVSCFYSLKDTATPVKVASISLVLNIVLNVILMFPLKLNGLALATSISGIFNFFLLVFVLRKKIGPLDGHRIMGSLVRVVAASIFMVLFIYLAAFKISLSLFAVIFIGIVSYVVASLALGVKEAKGFLRWALRIN